VTFTTPLDELHHWLGLLEIDLRLGIDQRHLNSTARLCHLLVEQLEEDPKLNRYAFNCLSLRLLDLQRAISARVKGPIKARPRLRMVGP
jgi:hypothetical protein